MCHSPNPGIALAALAALAAALVLVPPETAAAQEEDYEETIQEAVAEFNASRFEEARALFRHAHRLEPNARTLRGIGLASFELRDYAEAYQALAASLVDERRALSERQRAATRELLERASRFVAVYTLVISSESAEVRVDELPAELGPGGELVLSIGAHVISARDGARAAEARVQVEGGEREELSLELEARGASERTAPASATPTDSGALDRPRSSAPRAEAGSPTPGRRLGLALTGAGLMAVAVAAGTPWIRATGDELDRCRQVVRAGGGCGNQGSLERARNAAVATTTTLGALGAAALVAGLVLRRPAPPASAAGVRCAPAGLGVHCRGRF